MIDCIPDLPSIPAKAATPHGVVRIDATSAIAPSPLIVVAAAPARPGHFAEREELDAALQAGTVDALLLFIDRHPNSRHRPEAEATLRRLGITPPQR